MVQGGDQALGPGSRSVGNGRGPAHRLMVGVVAHADHHNRCIRQSTPGGNHRHVPGLAGETHSLQVLVHPGSQSIQHVLGARPGLPVGAHGDPPGPAPRRRKPPRPNLYQEVLSWVVTLPPSPRELPIV